MTLKDQAVDKVRDLVVTINGELTLSMDQQHVWNVVRTPSTMQLRQLRSVRWSLEVTDAQIWMYSTLAAANLLLVCELRPGFTIVTPFDTAYQHVTRCLDCRWRFFTPPPIWLLVPVSSLTTLLRSPIESATDNR